MQKSIESKVCSLFRNFRSNQSQLNDHLDLLLKYKEIMPKESIFYRARTIGPENHIDLTFIDNEEGRKILNGYPLGKMMAPPIGKAFAGRMNKSGKSVLYLANNPEICCAEIRPIFIEMISVLRFKLGEDVNVLNLKSIDCSKEMIDV